VTDAAHPRLRDALMTDSWHTFTRGVVMKRSRCVVLAVLSVGCARAATVSPSGSARPPESGMVRPAASCCAPQAERIAERYRVRAISSRRFTHRQLWSALEPYLNAGALSSRQIGRSIQGRAIRAVTFGSGPRRVLLWSQMHGDESTATMALADLIAWFAARQIEDDDVRSRIASALTIVMVPMLNPDGAELFQRENAIGIDVNRDARRLSTPEARALKTLRDSIRPAYGFNLHDQGARTIAGSGGRQVAIALLAPAADELRSYGPVRAEARLIAAEIAVALQREIPGRIAKYNDAFEPRAFGDLMQQWGTSTVLIESGALPGDPEKQRLRALNVRAILTALDAIAADRHRAADPNAYESLPMNARATVDLFIRGGSLVIADAEPLRADLTLAYEESVAKLRPRVREVGDLSGVVALDTIDASGLFLHPATPTLEARDGARWLRIDAPALFTLRRGRDSTSALVRVIGGSR
jgi:hypothetical protein